mgnify:CR=1 FL=1
MAWTKNFLYPISNQSKLWRNSSYLIQYIEVPIHQSLGQNAIATSAKKRFTYINTEALYRVSMQVWYRVSKIRVVSALFQTFWHPVFYSLFRPRSMFYYLVLNYFLCFLPNKIMMVKKICGLIFDVNSSNIWCTKSRKDFNDFRTDKDLSWKDALLAITSLLRP